jgi:hypothetical protein
VIPFLPVPEGVLVTLTPDDVSFLSEIPEVLESLGHPSVDPAAARLRAPVYLEDDDASEEWWRLMADEFKQSRAADRSAFSLILEASVAGTVASVAEAEAFLRVLNEGRLAIAARLEVEEEGDLEKLDEDEQEVLDYLASIQQLLVIALMGGELDL